MSAQPARAAVASPAATTSINSTSEANGSLTPELIIALCGPIGSPLHESATQISNILREFNYTTEELRLSTLIRLNVESTDKKIDSSSKYSEIKSLIDIGDELRKEHGADVLAKLAIAKIGGDRSKNFGSFEDVANEDRKPPEKKIKNQRICHVVDSIKNSAELDLLRLIYGDALIAVGVFSPLEVRRVNLERLSKLTHEQIDQLIDTDSGEEFSHGQSVRDTFPRCDFFLRADYPATGATEGKAISQLGEKIRRFFDLIFRTAVISPTTEETAMYAAASAARNSACMSRQVGAAVTSATGELLAVGWNDAPQSGGGLYGKLPASPKFKIFSEQVISDQRCFAQTAGKCHNDAEKSSIAEKIVDSLIKESVVDPSAKRQAITAIMGDTRVKDLIEFSRAVHAEMHAILGASRVAGDRVLDGKIFVTTYPCHACARHLVAAGISEIHYIEPYRKSLATRLHEDALTESTDAGTKVQLLQFDGVAPRRFIDLFEGGSRKKQGVLALLKRNEASPSTLVSLRAIPRLEEVVVAEIGIKALRLHSLLPGEDNDTGPTQRPAA
jgi:deoxycytidylate deaminase